MYLLALPTIQTPYQLSTIPTLPYLTSFNGISILDLSLSLSVDDETPTFPDWDLDLPCLPIQSR